MWKIHATSWDSLKELTASIYAASSGIAKPYDFKQACYKGKRSTPQSGLEPFRRRRPPIFLTQILLRLFREMSRLAYEENYPWLAGWQQRENQVVNWAGARVRPGISPACIPLFANDPGFPPKLLGLEEDVLGEADFFGGERHVFCPETIPIIIFTGLLKCI